MRLVKIIALTKRRANKTTIKNTSVLSIGHNIQNETLK